MIHLGQRASNLGFGGGSRCLKSPEQGDSTQVYAVMHPDAQFLKHTKPSGTKERNVVPLSMSMNLDLLSKED